MITAHSDAYLANLGRLERELTSIREEVDALRRPRWYVAVRRSVADVLRFLRCWFLGHPEDARQGAGCPRCNAWIPLDAETDLQRSAAGLAALYLHEWNILTHDLSRCDAGGWHAYGEGPCFKTHEKASVYRDRLDAAGVRWLPNDRRRLLDRLPLPRRNPGTRIAPGNADAPQVRRDLPPARYPVPVGLVLR